MKTKITRYPGEYVDIGHWFVGVQEIMEDRVLLHLGCEHQDTVVTVTSGEAYKSPEGDTLLIAVVGEDSSGKPCCTLGFLTEAGVLPTRTEGARVQ